MRKLWNCSWKFGSWSKHRILGIIILMGSGRFVFFHGDTFVMASMRTGEIFVRNGIVLL